MTYKTHLSTGLLFSSIVFLVLMDLHYSPILILSLAIATIIGSSSPDLDTPTGELWDKIPAGGVLSRLINPVFIGGHRHLSHSLIGFVLFTGLFYLVLSLIPDLPILHATYYLLLAFAIGYASHIFADLFTEMGVPLLFPLGYHLGIPPIKRIRIKTGRWFENLIIYPIVTAALLIIIYLYLIAV